MLSQHLLHALESCHSLCKFRSASSLLSFGFSVLWKFLLISLPLGHLILFFNHYNFSHLRWQFAFTNFLWLCILKSLTLAVSTWQPKKSRLFCNSCYVLFCFHFQHYFHFFTILLSFLLPVTSFQLSIFVTVMQIYHWNTKMQQNYMLYCLGEQILKEVLWLFTDVMSSVTCVIICRLRS